MSVVARYSKSHPDRIKMRKEIAALRQEFGVSTDTSELELQLKRLKGDLAALRQRLQTMKNV